jgi:isopenicillin N synthase-like dioxygenase
MKSQSYISLLWTGNLEARKAIAARVRTAAQNTGFFYIENHGIPEELIQDALAQAKAFFAQPLETKEKQNVKRASHADGWHGVGSSQINKTESRGEYPRVHLSHQYMTND